MKSKVKKVGNHKSQKSIASKSQKQPRLDDLLLRLNKAMIKLETLADRFPATGVVPKVDLYRFITRAYRYGREFEKSPFSSDLTDFAREVLLPSMGAKADWYSMLIRLVRPGRQHIKLASRWARACRHAASAGWSPAFLKKQLGEAGGVDALVR